MRQLEIVLFPGARLRLLLLPVAELMETIAELWQLHEFMRDLGPVDSAARIPMGRIIFGQNARLCGPINRIRYRVHRCLLRADRAGGFVKLTRVHYLPD